MHAKPTALKHRR